MTVGLSTYAFFWQWHSTARHPLDLFDLVNKTAAFDVRLFQICDYPKIEAFHAGDVDRLHRAASSAGVALELGTRGVRPDHLRKYLDLAGELEAPLVRSMINSADHRPTPPEAVSMLREITPAYEQAGVTLALETYEQVPVTTLVDIIEQVNSPNLGICLDPGNCVAALELPGDTIARTAPHVRNLHVKDFTFTRKDGWVGFTFAGCPLGEGLLDYDAMIDAVRPDERGINQIVEHWLPWQGDSATTIALEDQWTLHSLTYLRSREA